MKFTPHVLALAAIAAPITGHSLTVSDLQSQGLAPMSGEEVRQMATGNTLDHKMAGTRTVAHIYYRADGTRTVDAKAFGGRVYDTKWWMDGNQRCEISARTQQAQCGLVFKRSDDYVFCITGDDICAWTFTVRLGNPNGLGQ